MKVDFFLKLFVSVLIMSPLSRRGGDMLVHPCPLVCPQQTGDADLSWSNAGPTSATLAQHQTSTCSTFRQFVLGVFCAMSLSPFISLQRFLSYRRASMRRWPNAGLLLAHRLRRWANISPVLGYRVVFGATLNVGQRYRRRANINPTLVQSILPVLYRQHTGTVVWSTD